MQEKKELINNERYNMDKKKKNTLLFLGLICAICYIVFEILYLYSLYSQRDFSGVILEETAEQIKSRGNIRNIFELGIYIFFLIYSWFVWSYNIEKKYSKYLIYMACVIVSIFLLGVVFLVVQYILMGTVSSNHFLPGIILVWFSVLNLLITSGMQAKKDKQNK